METTDNNIVKFRMSTFLAMIVAIISFTFSVSGFYFSTIAMDHKIDAEKQRMVEEVGGLRADWERENVHVHKEFEEIKKELKELKKK